MIFVGLLVFGSSSTLVGQLLIKGRYRRCLTDNYIVSRYLHSGTDDSILVQLVIRSMLSVTSFQGVRDAELLPLLFFVVVSAIKNTAEETSVDSTLIQHDRIFLVIAGVAGNSDDGVAASRKFLETQILHGLGTDQRLLGIVENVSEGVHSHLVVRAVHSHGLFSHSRLIGVPGTLVMVREGNDTGTHSQDHSRVDFTMCIRVLGAFR